jgi:PPK2 family polyphosphate:nucleotide phosphotransferase
MNLKSFQVPTDKTILLNRDYDPAFLPDNITKEQSVEQLRSGIETLTKLQDVLYAHNRYGLLLIFQAMDAAGKDSTIKHVMSGVNPQGCQVFSFKTPSDEELDHDYLWRYSRCLPERGRIGIFNRSYYEEVLIARIHSEILDRQHLPHRPKGDRLWEQRFEEINHFEQYLTNNGIIILKFFLNISKTEQKKRFLKRIDTPEKNWKFSISDIEARQYWDNYQQAYENVFNHTSTETAPWYIIPADRKWYTRLAVADIITQRLSGLDLSYPKINPDQKAILKIARDRLEAESIKN